MQEQLDLFDLSTTIRQSGSQTLMQAMDRINRRFPKGIAVEAAGFDQSWKAKAERVSKRYTTDWRELVTVKV
jgi:DNA polymerase V